MSWPAKRHFQVRWQEVEATTPPYGVYVRSERDRLGPNHPLFLSQYELVAAEGVGRLFGAVHLQLLEGDHPRLQAPVGGERYVAGLDVAGDGDGGDATVLTIGRVVEERCEVVHHVAWKGAEFGPMVAEVGEICRRWGVGRLVVDATGMGARSRPSLRSSEDSWSNDSSSGGPARQNSGSGCLRR